MHSVEMGFKAVRENIDEGDARRNPKAALDEAFAAVNPDVARGAFLHARHANPSARGRVY